MGIYKYDDIKDGFQANTAHQLDAKYLVVHQLGSRHECHFVFMLRTRLMH